jgi:plastocyanin
LSRSALAAVSLGLLVLTACGGDGSGDAAAPSKSAPAPSGPVVKMPLTQFSPAEISVKVGDTLTWENSNDIGHTIVSGTYEVDTAGQRTTEKADGTFDLEVAKKGDAVTHTFTKAGTFTYYCSIHKAMNGTVTVA